MSTRAIGGRQPTETQMQNVLVLQNSANLENSVSRRLVDAYVSEFQKSKPGATVAVRDLVRNPIPHIAPVLINHQITGAGDPQDPNVALSDALIEELEAADIVVIGAPFYNFTIPSTLKAWLDNVVRAGRTFQYVDGAPVGLLPRGKKVIVFLASGGAYTEAPGSAADFFEPYLRFILGVIGLTDVEFVRSELQVVPELGQRNTEVALEKAKALAL